jgi:hypothetical protein
MTDVAIIGAGPYGLACAAHLRGTRQDVAIFGDTMASWRDLMPAGMRLRSSWDASTISGPGDGLTLDAYEASLGRRIPRPVPLQDFIAYGEWFAENGVGAIDDRRVLSVESVTGGFRLNLDDGDGPVARRVVVATGVAAFPNRPAHLRDLPGDRVVHTGDLTDPGAFAGERVVVLGAGQSGVETTALLAEGGAHVELVARASTIRWLRRSGFLHSLPPALRSVFYPPTDVGPPVLNRLAAVPEVMRRLPTKTRDRIAYRCIRPAAAGWLTPRVRDVPMTIDSEDHAVVPDGDGLTLRMSDGSTRKADRVVLATGYRVDVSRLDLLSPAIRAELRTRIGSPVLGAGFASSVPGLHFVGAFAAPSYGPVMRFVSGTWSTAPVLARYLDPAGAEPAPVYPAPLAARGGA